MRHAFAFREWHLRSGDLYLLVNLDGVAVDDLAVEVERDFDTERAFPGRSWTDNRDDWRLHWIHAHAREDSTRKIAITQMSVRISSTPMIWLREKRTRNPS